MKGKFQVGLFCLFIAFFSLSAVGSATEFVSVKKKEKCPVCGMFVYKYKKWVAEITFKDGSYRVFDGCKDMFKFYFNMSRYEKKLTKNDIANVYVTEYYTTKVMKANELFFVVGSDVLGPMGHELIPVYGETKAKIFKLDHSGKDIYRFNDVSPDTIPH